MLACPQVSNWFINARVRLWKPMVEEMYVEEMKAEGQDGGGQQQVGVAVANNPNPSSAGHASEAAEDDGRGDSGGGAVVDRKPTRAQLLHDAGSLASVVNIGGGSRAGFGIMDHLDFDAYGGHHAGAVSLTLGLQQHDSHADTGAGGVNIAFGAPPPAHHHGYLFAPTTAAAGHQMGAGVHPGIHHHVQFSGAGAGIDGGEAAHGQEHYRGLQGGGGFHLLRDLAG